MHITTCFSAYLWGLSFMVGAFYSIVTGQVLQHITPKRMYQAQELWNLPSHLFCLYQVVAATHPVAASVGGQSRSGITSIPSVLSSPGECVPVDKPPPRRLTLTPRGSRPLSRVPLNPDLSDHFQQNMVPWTLWGGVLHEHAHMLTGSLIVKTDKCVSLVQNLRTFILSIHLWIIQRGQWCARFPKLIYFL